METDKYIVQQSWNDNLAAILATYCKRYNLQISKTSIYNSFCEEDKMQDFVNIEQFAKKYNLEYTGGVFDETNFDDIDAPYFVLVKGYRTVLITDVSDKIHYLDCLTGENDESRGEFLDYATGYYYRLNPESDYTPEVNYESLVALEAKNANKKEWNHPELIELTPEKLMEDFNDRV